MFTRFQGIQIDRKGYVLAILVFVLLSILVIQAITSISMKSPTFGEIIYIVSGYYMHKTDDLGLHSGHLILLQKLMTLPLASL